MTKREFQQLIANGESESMEFKSSFDRETVETLTAFANSKGGRVLIGITNQGDFQGIQLGKETIQQWVNQVKLNTAPSIIPDVETLTIDKKLLVIMKIIEYPVKPISCRGKYFKRVQNSNHQMSINEISSLHLKTFHKSWDHYDDYSHTLDDISLEKVNHFMNLANKVRSYPITDDPMTVLKKYELLKGESISHGCYLLFVEGESFMSTIEMGRFATETVIKDSMTIRFDLISEVEAVLGFIRKHIGKAYISSPGTHNAKNDGIIPPKHCGRSL